MMTPCIRSTALIVPTLLALASPVRAEVTAQDSPGFVSRNAVVVAGTPAAVWKRLVAPAGWWSSDHTFSGDAANLTLDPVAGGCFCERLPAAEEAPAKPGAPRPPARGGVEHMRVVFVDHAKALRLVGALGPLQSEAVNATLTITLKPGKRAVASACNASMAAASATSLRMPCTCGSRRRASSRRRGSRPVTMTVLPRSRSWRASSRPMPSVPPVIRIVRCRSCMKENLVA